jgi:small subunit ribosomal protein S1
VILDGLAAHPAGVVGPLDGNWPRHRAEGAAVGQRITAEVIAVDPDEGLVRLSTAATEDRELWMFLERLQPGEVLSGSVAAIETFGVFVALEDGPEHPLFPGSASSPSPRCPGSLSTTLRTLSRSGSVSCEFLHFDTWNGEARLSLRALRPGPFTTFAEVRARIDAGEGSGGRR